MVIFFFRIASAYSFSRSIDICRAEKEYHYTQWMVGLSFLPINQVVFKVDYGQKTVELGSVTTDLFNLGVGYMF